MILGIDPGSKGGLAFIDSAGSIQNYQKMTNIFDFPNLNGVKKCFIEKCQSRPNQSIQAMFNYGVHFGQIVGYLTSKKIPYVLVSPRRWQNKMLGKFKKGESKQAALIKAKELWPSESFIPNRSRKPHDGIIDACLLAEYGRVFWIKEDK